VSAILHVTTVHGPFDTRIYEKEVRGLAERGHRVALATTLERPAQRNGVKILALGAGGGHRARRIVRDARALRVIFSHRRDIVHIHDPELLLVVLLPALFGVRVVYDVHEFYRERIADSGWIPRPLRALVSAAYSWFEQAVVPRCAGVVVVSEEMEPLYRRHVGAERIALVKNFPNIAPERIERAKSSAHPLDGRPYAVHTGGANRLRAFSEIVEAAEQLRRRGSELAIVNVGPIDLSDYPLAEREELLARAASCGLVMTGPVAYDESLTWLAHARIGYLPLLDVPNNRRGTPNKLFEYLLFGLPVAASEVNVTAQTLLRESQCGVLVPCGDGTAHGDALDLLHRDASAYASRAEASTRASRRYSFESELLKLERLYACIDEEARA
jgi:glycosyltransferase involved in cell wall biosynthesis